MGKSVFVSQMYLNLREYWYYGSIILILWRRTYYWSTDFKFALSKLSNI